MKTFDEGYQKGLEMGAKIASDTCSVVIKQLEEEIANLKVQLHYWKIIKSEE